jgi:hypothetical protein
MRIYTVKRTAGHWRALVVMCALALLAVACGGSGKPTEAVNGSGDVHATQTGVAYLRATATEVARQRAPQSPTALNGSPAATAPAAATRASTGVIELTPIVPTRVGGSPDAGQPTPTSGPPPTPTTFGLGFVHRWNPLFYQAAVYAVDASATPVNGKPIIAVDAEECMQAGAPAERVQTAQPGDFHLTLADGSDLAPTTAATHDNPFAETQLKSGQCVRGWISYELPVGGVAERVVFNGKLVSGQATAHVTGYWSTTQTQ